MPNRRFPPPWSIEEYNEARFIVHDSNGQALAYFYFEEEPGRRSAAKLLTKDEARRMAVNFAKRRYCYGSRDANRRHLLSRFTASELIGYAGNLGARYPVTSYVAHAGLRGLCHGQCRKWPRQNRRRCARF
jgi:hypothetical protein